MIASTIQGAPQRMPRHIVITVATAAMLPAWEDAVPIDPDFPTLTATSAIS